MSAPNNLTETAICPVLYVGFHTVNSWGCLLTVWLCLWGMHSWKTSLELTLFKQVLADETLHIAFCKRCSLCNCHVTLNSAGSGAAAARLGEPLRLMDLPDNVLLRIAVRAGFPHRLSAMQGDLRCLAHLHNASCYEAQRQMPSSGCCSLRQLSQVASLLYIAHCLLTAVCKRLNSILHHPRFTRTVGAGQTIMETVRQARAGDTIVVPPGLYDVSSLQRLAK